MANTRKNWPWMYVIALLSETWATRWRWESAPTHQLRDWYEHSFGTYFLESFTPWLVAFTALTAIWLLITRIRNKQTAK